MSLHDRILRLRQDHREYGNNGILNAIQLGNLQANRQ